MTNGQEVWKVDLGVNTDIDIIKITVGVSIKTNGWMDGWMDRQMMNG